jgi:hypothetical protein
MIPILAGLALNAFAGLVKSSKELVRLSRFITPLLSIFRAIPSVSLKLES